MTNTGYINAHSVCLLLEKIAGLSVSVPITLVMDNARYQRCVLVQTFARNLGIELLFLPSYSPNLNLIERLWKFIKKKCLYSKYYPDFAAFRHAITTCIENPHLKYKADLDSLMTLEFQSFQSSDFASVMGVTETISHQDILPQRQTLPPVCRAPYPN